MTRNLVAMFRVEVPKTFSAGVQIMLDLPALERLYVQS